MAFGKSQHRALRFWRDLEAFIPQEIDGLQASHRVAPPTFVERQGRWWPESARQMTVRLEEGAHGVLPWSVAVQVQEHKARPQLADLPWASHRLYLGLVESAQVSETLLALAPMQGMGGPSEDIARLNFEEKWRASGRCALLALEVDAEGHLLEEAAFVSSLVPGLLALAQGRVPPGGLHLDGVLRQERQALAERWAGWAKSPDYPVDMGFLCAEVTTLKARLPNLGPGAWVPFVWVESFPSEEGRKPVEVREMAIREPLNSFYFEPLHQLVQALDPESPEPQTPSAALEAFLDAPRPESDRLDVLADPVFVAHALHPRRWPLAAWPSREPLSPTQVVAINTLGENLKDGGLQALHTPPGTGPWDVAKAIVAQRVQERADLLAQKEQALDWLVLRSDSDSEFGPTWWPSPDLLKMGAFVITADNPAVLRQAVREFTRSSRLGVKGCSYLAPLAQLWQVGEADRAPVWGPAVLDLSHQRNAIAQGQKLLFGQPVSAEGGRLPGLRHLFRNEVKWSPPDWGSARQRYLRARSRVVHLRQDLVESLEQGQALLDAWKRRPVIERQYAQAAEALAVWGTEEDQMQGPLARARDEAVEQWRWWQREHDSVRGRWLAAQQAMETAQEQHTLSSTNRALAKVGWGRDQAEAHQKAWQAAVDRLEGAQAEMTTTDAAWEKARVQARETNQEWTTALANWREGHRQRHTRMLALQEQLANLQMEIEALESQVDPVVRLEIERWNQPLASRRHHHLHHPWASKDWPEAQVWQDARKELFCCAMELHEAALASWREKLENVLFRQLPQLLVDPSSVPLTQREPLWNLLAFLCPVLTVPLSQVARQMTGLRPGALAWTFVADAGRSSPGSVAGVLQSSHRAVLMGDLRQSEPRVPIAPSLIDRLVEAHQVDPRYRPDRTSAQVLADERQREGAWMEGFVGGEEVRTWTGLPLRTHRQCQSPMFDLANRIAYADHLVQATPESHLCRDGRVLSSYWQDVDNQEGNRLHLAMEIELRALADILRTWKNRPPTCGATGTERPATLVVLSPFRAVAEAARGQIAAVGLAKQVLAGTPREFQGQAFDTVVLVLGTPTGAPGVGARQWASQGPALLNVAITCARHQLVVVGSKRDWQARPGFDALARTLPTQMGRS